MTIYQAIKGVRRLTTLMTWDSAYGSYNGSYPASNLTSLPLARVSRSTNLTLASTRWKGTADTLRAMRLLGIIRHNISLSGMVRVRLYVDTGLTCTADSGTNLVSATSHGLANGAQVVIWTTGTMPGGITSGTVYYARSVTSGTFSLHLTYADAIANTNIVDITSAGTGTHEVLRNLAYDSDWQEVWPVVYTDASLEWEDDNWWNGKYTSEEISGRNWTWPYLLSTLTSFRVITIEVDDQTNASGVIDIGMVEIAKGWVFGTNFTPGAQFGFRFRSRAVESWGGVIEHERLEKPRTFRGQISMLDMDEVWGQAFEDLFQQDVTEPFLWMPHPDNNTHWLRNTFLARNVDPGQFSYHAIQDVGTVPLALEEVL